MVKYETFGPRGTDMPKPTLSFKKDRGSCRNLHHIPPTHPHSVTPSHYHTPWQTAWEWVASYHCILISLEEGKVKDWAQERRGHTEVQVGCFREHWWGSQLSPADNLLPVELLLWIGVLGVKDFAKMHIILTCEPLTCWFIDLKGNRTC